MDERLHIGNHVYSMKPLCLYKLKLFLFCSGVHLPHRPSSLATKLRLMELICMKQSAGFIIGILLLLLSLVIFNSGASNNNAALSLFVAALLIIGVTELTIKIGKKR
ncbi:hypothetical protein [Sporolactobacillus shoreicorticis]|uniref:Uncharacterized protein n=2 Tax=Sporolactobacillus shoreicorticis TaxID=1923877 RepID=A0ABW5S7T2_9BACL